MPARFDAPPLPYSSTKPLPTRSPQPGRHAGPSSHHPGRSPQLGHSPNPGGGGGGGTIKRSKTLTRPERQVAPVPLIAPPPIGAPQGHGHGSFSDPSGAGGGSTESGGLDWWKIWSYATTWWAPPAVLRWFGIKEKQSRQAWREKITLCWIAVVLGGVVGFATMGLQRALCPGGEDSNIFERLGSNGLTLSVGGWVVNVSTSLTQDKVDFYAISKQMPGQDITNLFLRSSWDYPACTGISARYASTPICSAAATSGVKENGTLQACPLPRLSDATLNALRIQNTTAQEGYSWDQVAALPSYLVIDGVVLNMSPYIAANPTPILSDPVDTAIRQVLSNQSASGKDATRLFYNQATTRDALPCLTSRYLAGHIDKITPGCFIASLFLYTSLTVILGVVMVRFAMACIFNWFISARLVRPPKDLYRAGVSPAVMPEGANVSVHNKTGTAPWAVNGPGESGSVGSRKLKSKKGGGGGGMSNNSSTTLVNQPGGGTTPAEPVMSLARIGAELFTVCLVTCYSEGEESVRGTVESIASTNYSDQRKLIWIVCDGMITGAGESRSTPDICVGMLDADPRFGNPMPMGFIAVGSGGKRENRAMVYAGHYVSRNGHRTPTIIVVKCGMPSESRDKKPGNRGKRDSQMILMNFFHRVTYNDRMSPLDFDIFRKVQVLMGVTPDFFEVVLMVDADTKIYPDSLRMLVNCMQSDNMVMGVCGETRIANKRQSWVTAIQVYEYFISHHLAKAFESVFGGVTCLPGCFSMYRIKARKDYDNDWVPILVKPEIIREYSQSDVHTLHQKNLLLLGEDRFLSTILLRAFPHRKNIFLPQARCRTIAPDSFSVLLSQRRRWINSTIHNLMELVRVRNLCGTFCFSMQFVVFMDLVGTVVLPVSICLTGALIVNSIITPPRSFQEAIPLMLLAAVLGLPAILILITTRKVIYVAWMLCYLLALPIWNFVLPVYAFWHFDDFSWGETRRVEGEVRSKAHDDKTAVFDGTTIPLRRWEDWEKSRLRKLRREEKRRRDMERKFGQIGYLGDETTSSSEGGHAGFGAGGGGRSFEGNLGLHPWTAGSGPGGGGRARSEYDPSDAGSVFSSDEDVWGGEIGGYNENNPSFPPPPIALPPRTNADFSPGLGNGATVGMDEMAAMLEEGFSDDPSPPTLSRPNRSYASSPFQNRVVAETIPLNRWEPNASPTHDGGWGTSNGGGSGRASPHGANAGYTEINVPIPNTVNGAGATGVSPRIGGTGHAKKRSGGRAMGGNPMVNGHGGGNGYGPLGPLEDDDAGWGRVNAPTNPQSRGYGGSQNGHGGGYGAAPAGGGGGYGQGTGSKGKRI